MATKRVVLSDDKTISRGVSDRGARIDLDELRAQQLAEKDLKQREIKINERDLQTEGKPPVA
jgi:hypothetical protein